MLLVLLACTYCTSLFGQTNYSIASLENLHKLKADAVKENDFTKAAEIKQEIDIREAEQKKINELQIELDKKVKQEDFDGAAVIKEQLKVLKDKKDRKEELRKQIATAVENNDFESAAKYKAELSSLTSQNNQEKKSTANPASKGDTYSNTSPPSTIAQKDKIETTTNPKIKTTGIFYNYVSGLPIGFKFFERGTVLSLGYGENDYAGEIIRLNCGIEHKGIYGEVGVLAYDDFDSYAFDWEVGYVARFGSFGLLAGLHGVQAFSSVQLSGGIGWWF